MQPREQDEQGFGLRELEANPSPSFTHGNPTSWPIKPDHVRGMEIRDQSVMTVTATDKKEYTNK